MFLPGRNARHRKIIFRKHIHLAPKCGNSHCAAQHASVGPTGAEFHWGVGSMDELTAAHPRLALQRQQSVSECYGWPGVVLETLWWPWLGAPLYGMATLGVDGA